MAVTFLADLASTLDRELRGVLRQLEAYPDERLLWQPVAALPNTAGTLALHLAGNLQHFFGAGFAGNGYVRNREAEFARRDVSRAELAAEIERARAAVAAGVERVRPADLEVDAPEPLGGYRVRVGDMLVHAVAHVAYHLAQIDAHRRTVTVDVTSLGMLRPDELRSARAP